MAKQSKNKKNPNIKKLQLVVIVLIALIGMLALTGIFAQSSKGDYSLKVPTEQTAISLSDNRPLVATKDDSGRITYESRGKSINVTTSGTVYCTPPNDGDIKVATISDKQLTETIKQLDNNRLTDGLQKNDKLTATVGDNTKLQLSDSSKPTTIEGNTNQTPESITNAEQALDLICSQATTTIPSSQAPAFVPKSSNSTEYTPASPQSWLRHLVPTASAGGTTPTVVEPRLAPEVEADHINRANQERRNRNLTLMGKSDCLTKAARTWSRQMAIVDTLYHSPLVQTVETECGRDWWRKIGENVGYGPDTASLFQAYMNSPGHRANILDPAFQRIGVGANYYQHPNKTWTVLWTTQLFAACQGSCANK